MNDEAAPQDRPDRQLPHRPKEGSSVGGRPIRSSSQTGLQRALLHFGDALAEARADEREAAWPMFLEVVTVRVASEYRYLLDRHEWEFRQFRRAA
jgi:hypothetical protein